MPLHIFPGLVIDFLSIQLSAGKISFNRIKQIEATPFLEF
jgi:hypothetical protein